MGGSPDFVRTFQQVPPHQGTSNLTLTSNQPRSEDTFSSDKAATLMNDLASSMVKSAIEMEKDSCDPEELADAREFRAAAEHLLREVLAAQPAETSLSTRRRDHLRRICHETERLSEELGWERLVANQTMGVIVEPSVGVMLAALQAGQPLSTVLPFRTIRFTPSNAILELLLQDDWCNEFESLAELWAGNIVKMLRGRDPACVLTAEDLADLRYHAFMTIASHLAKLALMDYYGTLSLFQSANTLVRVSHSRELLTTRSSLRTRHLVLRDLFQFHLVDIVAIDRIGLVGRFVVKYLLLSHVYNARTIVTLFTNETLSVPSLCSVFPAAGWPEREVWDLFGLYFHEHGDLRRILTDYGFSAHPLRKDFPLSGFHEVIYNDAEGRVTTEPIELAQELRVFSYL